MFAEDEDINEVADRSQDQVKEEREKSIVYLISDFVIEILESLEIPEE